MPGSRPLIQPLASLLLGLASLYLTACCCPGGDSCSSSACDPGACAPDIPATPRGPEVDLGIAPYPPGTPTAGAAIHTWIARDLDPNRYKVGFALSPQQSRTVQDAHVAFARKVGYRSIDDDTFTWSPPVACQGDMRCVFAELGRSNRDDIRALAARFEARVRDSKLDALQAADLVVSFVQHIRYQVPASEPFGILPPALVVSDKYGDCDSKAFLGQMLLHELGIESILVSSQAHKHTMLGIALPVQGDAFAFGTSRFAFTECTAEGSPIGHINPELLHPNDWRPVPVDLK